MLGRAEIGDRFFPRLEVVAAHLVHLEKTEEMVKQTQGLMDEVLKDKSMSLKEKIEDLHMLTDHLSFLQESAT